MLFLLFGSNGQLGWELQRALLPYGEVVALSSRDADLANPESLRSIVRNISPSMIINAAAYTAVDRAESEPDLAYAVNCHSPRVMAEETHKLGAVLIHFSTDYVFDGLKGAPYLETDNPNPINVYGASKLAGEHAIQEVGGNYLILRTSWLYSLRRDSFVNKVLQWARQKSVIRVVTDQVGSPTWCRALAEVSSKALAIADNNALDWIDEHCGVYHLSCAGAVSRFEWAQAILRYDPSPQEQIVELVEPALSDEFQTPAKRPPNSSLSNELFNKTFGLYMPHWDVALKMALEVK